MITTLLRELTWPSAFTVVGVAWAIAFGVRAYVRNRYLDEPEDEPGAPESDDAQQG